MHMGKHRRALHIRRQVQAVDHHNFGINIIQCILHDPVSGCQLIRSSSAVVGSNSVFLPQFHRKYTIHHVAGSHKKDIIFPVPEKVMIFVVAALVFCQLCQGKQQTGSKEQGNRTSNNPCRFFHFLLLLRTGNK